MMKKKEWKINDCGEYIHSQSQEAQSQRFCSYGREAGKVSELVHISQIGGEILHYSFFFLSKAASTFTNLSSTIALNI